MARFILSLILIILKNSKFSIINQKGVKSLIIWIIYIRNLIYKTYNRQLFIIKVSNQMIKMIILLIKAEI